MMSWVGYAAHAYRWPPDEVRRQRQDDLMRLVIADIERARG